MRRGIRRALLVLIAVVFALSIPWYREAGAEPSVWLGLPDWVAVALVCYFAAAILNAAAWFFTEIPETPSEPGGARSPGSSGGVDEA